MSTGLIVLIVVACVLVCAGFAALVIALVRRTNRGVKAKHDRLDTEAARRGWRYADSVGPTEPVVPVLVQAGQLLPNRMDKVRWVTTGNHRQHPFISASCPSQLPVQSGYANRPDIHALGIQLPVSLPRISATRTTRFESHVNQAAGGDWKTGNPEFDKVFDVETENAALAADLLNADLVAWLLGDPSAKGRGFDLGGDWLWVNSFTQVGGAAGDVDKVVHGLDFLCDVFDRIPATVWERAR